MDTEYITTREAAHELARLKEREEPYTLCWIGNLIQRKKVVAKKFGRDWMVDRASLRAYAERDGGYGAPSQEGYVTVAQAATALGLTRAGVYYRLEIGTLVAVEIGGYKYISETELLGNEG